VSKKRRRLWLTFSDILIVVIFVSPLFDLIALILGILGTWSPCTTGQLCGPLRLRLPRQLGYKSVKFITQLTVTDNLKKFGKDLGFAAPEAGYAWRAGI